MPRVCVEIGSAPLAEARTPIAQSFTVSPCGPRLTLLSEV